MLVAGYFYLNNQVASQSNSTMDKLEQMTEPLGFIRVHKGFLVNYQYIHRVMPGEIILSDGTRIPIGRSHSGEVKAKFLSLVGG